MIIKSQIINRDEIESSFFELFSENIPEEYNEIDLEKELQVIESLLQERKIA